MQTINFLLICEMLNSSTSNATNSQLQLASDFVQFTDRNIFLTGKAGTGKTTFLHHLRENCPKRMVVVAPTGVAAINAKGSTIHSFFQMSFGPFLPANKKENPQKDNYNRKFSREKINLIKSIDLLVIDEISMVRADTLDGIDEVLRRYRDKSKQFVGVQLLMIGDLHQLSPVVKEDDWQILKEHYENLYFFNSKALLQTLPISIELKHIYRQSDAYFIDILNAVRENKIDATVLEKLNQRYIPHFEPDEDEGYITLTSHNQSANAINEEKLKSIKLKEYRFTAKVSGDFPEFSYPNAFELVFKIGAQVMFVKNDIGRDKLYFNGKIGKIIEIKQEFIKVKCPHDSHEIVVGKAEWANYKFELNPETKEIEERIAGTFSQYPLKLAWAITIHKSQGLTFEKAIIDANAAFAHGQVYVALSRCKSFEGMVLRTPISFNSVKTDGTVSKYTKEAENNEPTEKHLINSKITFQQNLLNELFDFQQIKIVLFQCKKLGEDNYAVISVGFLDLINNLRDQADNKILAVADKFKKQMAVQLQENGLPEDNPTLQERIKKGCIYFKEQLDLLLTDLNKLDFDADNKAVKKSLTEVLEQLQKEIFIKQSALKLCAEGFQTLAYLKTKANAEIDFNNQKAKVALTEKPLKAVAGVKYQDLYHQIKTWRDNLAKENDVPVYQILPQKVLTDLVNSLPSNALELESIKGFGKIKVKQYGNELLMMINEYCARTEISRTPFQLLVKTQKEKTDTKATSLALFKEGKSIKEIAEIRGFAASTIETHLTHYLETGEINIYDFVDKSKVETIREYILEHKPLSMNDTKAALGDDFSYGEIRAVMKFIALDA